MYILRNKDGYVMKDEYEIKGILTFPSLTAVADFLSYVYQENCTEVEKGWYAQWIVTDNNLENKG